MTRLPDTYKGAILSNATLRTQDLVQAFMAVLEDEQELLFSDPESWNTRTFRHLQATPDVVKACNGEWSEPFADIPYNTHETLTIALDQMFDLLSDVAPEGCTFGSSEGDGACFGFWEWEDEE